MTEQEVLKAIELRSNMIDDVLNHTCNYKPYYRADLIVLSNKDIQVILDNMESKLSNCYSDSFDRFGY
jgi:hypothetical protein